MLFQPGTHDYVAFDILWGAQNHPQLPVYYEPSGGHSQTPHVATAKDEQNKDAFLWHHFFGGEPLLQPPKSNYKISKDKLSVSVSFNQGPQPKSGRIWWIYDRAPAGSAPHRPLMVYPSGDYQIRGNTFFNNPSDAVRIVPDRDKMQSLNPEFSNNHIFNAGRYNTDVSGVYFPSRSQRYAEVHHNWFHNINGNAVRLDISGKELNVHHNVFWSNYRALSIEGYGSFNIYNNTAVHNQTPADLIRNVLSASTLGRLRSNPGVIDGTKYTTWQIAFLADCV
jgi:hypothetical protein